MNENVKKIGLGVVVAILCALAYYFLYWTKTPVYSANIIRESIAKHDVVTFEKHVDMDTLYGKGYDDAIIAIDRIEGNGISTNPFAMGILQMMKPAIVNELKAKTLEEIKGVDNGQSSKKNQATKMAEGLQEKADVKNADFKDITVVSKEKGEAIVAVTLHNKKFNKDFELKVKMAELQDGTWKLKEIINLVEFLVEVDKADKVLRASEKNAS